MSLSVISTEQMREWEKSTWAAGISSVEVIARVGKKMAELALRLTASHEKILILAGKGHNGDDARAAMPHLHQREVVLLDVTDPRTDREIFSAACLSAHQPKLILDGLFGIGLTRELNSDWQTLINAVNETNIPVLAIDVPSGLDADSGDVRGAAIRATTTLTVGAVKRGLLQPSAIPFVGRLELAADIGLIPCLVRTNLFWTNESDFENFPSPRKPDAHKGTFGHVTIFAGSLGYHGAAVLAVRGALRAQPGLVTVFTPENCYIPVASQLQAAMVHPWKSTREVPDSCSAILLGPGLAAKILPDNCRREIIEIWTECSLPVVVDASALDWLPPGGDFSNAIRIISPHPGEAARMLGISTDAVQADRTTALHKLSERFGNCLVVLKGHQTLVGRNDGDIFINSSGNPFLAQGGSGDVLAGYISGLIAQPGLQNEFSKTVRYAVWQHGAAADKLTCAKTNWTIDDLLGALGDRA